MQSAGSLLLLLSVQQRGFQTVERQIGRVKGEETVLAGQRLFLPGDDDGCGCGSAGRRGGPRQKDVVTMMVAGAVAAGVAELRGRADGARRAGAFLPNDGDGCGVILLLRKKACIVVQGETKWSPCLMHVTQQDRNEKWMQKKKKEKGKHQ